MKKLFNSLLVSIFFLIPLYSQKAQQPVLSSVNSSWQKVMPGELMSEPQETSYGFCFITDAKCLTCYSSNGNLLWDKPLKRATNTIFTVLPNDFFAVITNSGKRLALLNPGGAEIWYKNLDEPITQKPYAGRDGRIFVRNSHQVICYGINGIRKWSMETPEQTDTPIQELKDGSIIVFLKELVESKTKGLRISPFGELLEEIIFSGEVYSTTTCPEGVLISFTNGLSGLFSLVDDKAKNKWVVNKKNTSPLNKDFFAVSQNKQEAAFFLQYANKLKVNLINLENGEIKSSFEIPDIGIVKHCVFNQDGIFVTDNKNAYFYSTDGIELFGGIFPSKTKTSQWKYYLFTIDDYFIIFDKNWTANAFRTFQKVTHTKKEVNTVYNKKDYNYNEFYSINPSMFSTELMPGKIDEEVSGEKILEQLKEGDYSVNEQKWMGNLLSALSLRKEDLIQGPNAPGKRERSVFQTDYIGFQLLLKQVSLLGTDTFIDYMAFYLSHETDNVVIQTILEGIPQNAYDPDGKIINAIYHLSRRLSEAEDNTLIKICDAIYYLCIFNGKPAFYTKGKEILTLFIYPKYSTKVRNYARDTFKKISQLDF